MTKKQHYVLLVEDSPSQAEAYKAYLASEPLDVVHVTTGEDALEHLATEVPDVILLDLQLPGVHGMEVLNHVVRQELPSSVVVITDDGSVDVITAPDDFETVKQAMRDSGNPPDNAEVTFSASTTAELDAEAAEKLMKLVDALEDLDDVQEVYTNADISSEIMESLEG